MSVLSQTTGERISSFSRSSDDARLFLVYYPLPPGFNANKWGVTERSIDANIQSAVNKPVIIYRKNPNNPYHTHQAGNFVHPTIEEATAELGHAPSEEDYYNWQEKFSVGRVRDVEKRHQGYAFTLEITDPEAKNILKSDAYRTGIPGWTSPQIISNAHLYPEEEQSGIFDHWAVSHVILTDSPAYGFDKASLKGKCLGVEKECLIKTKSASQQNLGFCVKQAMTDLLDSHSSHIASISNSSHTTMSTNAEGTQPPTQQETVVTKTLSNTDSVQNNMVPNPELLKTVEQPTQQPQQEEQPETKQTDSEVKVNSIEEANATIGQMSTLIKDLQKTVKMQGKELERINIERKQARLSFIIPRNLFKSDESHMKEVQKTMSENVSESWLIEYWKTKSELMTMQQHSQPNKMETPLVAKGASTAATTHDVPDFSSSQDQNVRSIIQKQMELQKRILEGGTV